MNKIKLNYVSLAQTSSASFDVFFFCAISMRRLRTSLENITTIICVHLVCQLYNSNLYEHIKIYSNFSCAHKKVLKTFEQHFKVLVCEKGSGEEQSKQMFCCEKKSLLKAENELNLIGFNLFKFEWGERILTLRAI